MRVDFYQPVQRFVDDPQGLLASLAQKCLAQHQPALWLVRDLAAAEALDAYLWEQPEDAFLPHQICGDEDDGQCPLLIVAPGMRTKPRPVIFNDRDDAVAINVERVIELIPADPAGKSSARARWRSYVERGITPQRVEV